jgi:hypothetical protein
VPYASKSGLRDSSETFHARLPTNNFFIYKNSPCLDVNAFNYNYRKLFPQWPNDHEDTQCW